MKLRLLFVGIATALVFGLASGPAAATGDTQSAQQSALMGIGIELPPLSAAERQRLVSRADRGDLDAIYDLAHHALRAGGPLYFWGSWRNPKEAAEWWRKAAELGDPKAMILLGHLYAEPWGVPQDLPEAAKWFKMAAAKGRLEAIQDLAMLYMGVWSDERDDEQALIWLHQAAAMGDTPSMLNLAIRYDAGWGVREDDRAAADWYRKVIGPEHGRADSEQAVAMNNLGVLYEEGRGLPKDDAAAAALYRSALPNFQASYNLARLCEAGRGVVQDREGALWLYREAALFADWPEARQALHRLGFVPGDSETEAGALLDHDKLKVKTPCDP